VCVYVCIHPAVSIKTYCVLHLWRRLATRTVSGLQNPVDHCFKNIMGEPGDAGIPAKWLLTMSVSASRNVRPWGLTGCTS